jgi:hypothetical protein
MMSTLLSRVAPAVVAFAATLVVGAGAAHAADNDFVLSRYAEFEANSNSEQCGAPCGSAEKDEDLFHNLVTDFGQVMAPSFGAPSTTLGQAGFSVNLVPSISFVDDSAEHWQKGVEDGDPPGAMFVPALEVRKGLPFSFEIAGTMSHISGSDMFTVGSQLKWALHEGFRYFPDVAVRGTVNTLTGAKELQMVTAGWDASIGYGFPLGGIMEITPYAGYQQLHIWGWSRLLNVRPQDPRAPQKDSSSEGDPDNSFNPEFVFDTFNTQVNRFFFGTRLNVWTVNLILEGTIGEDVQQGTAALGMSF